MPRHPFSRGKKSEVEGLLNMAIEHHKTTSEQLKFYSDLRKEFAKYGIPVDDISHLAKVVDGVRALGYDPVKITNEISNLQQLRSEYSIYRSWIPVVKNELEGIYQKRSSLEYLVQSYNQTLSIYYELNKIGLGSKN
jgi:hypothetical protein